MKMLGLAKITAIVLMGLSIRVMANSPLSLEQLTQNVSKSNLSILQNAESVYEAKLNIEQARARLLPSLNLWKLARVAVDPIALLDVAEDIAPFLVPGNWFRLKESELIYKAEREGYRALRANELYNARVLYLKAVQDQHLLDAIAFQSNEMQDLLEQVKLKVLVGNETIEIQNQIEIQTLALQEDQRNLINLLQQEKSLLGFLAGMPIANDFDLVDVPVSSADFLNKIAYADYENKVITKSAEVKQFDHFLAILPQIKKEIYFNFLGASSISRGVGGGIFDSLPVPDGLGFANSSAVRIVRTEENIFKLRKQGVIETLKRQLKRNVDSYNLVIDSYSGMQRRRDLAERNFQIKKDKALFGEAISPLDLADSLAGLALAQANLLQLQYGFLMDKDLQARLQMLDFYDITQLR